MKEWSQQYTERMKVSFFLDTNILSYLVDNSYPKLNALISQIKDLCLCELISSEFVEYEFMGIRKKERYFRTVLRQDDSQNCSMINISSLLKNHNKFECPEIDFYGAIPNIKKAVENDIEKVTSDYGILFTCVFHSNLYAPIRNFCLSSKISKEDSFVLISAIFPQDNSHNEICYILSNDKDFCSWYTEADEKIGLSSIYEEYSLEKPIIIYTRNAWNKNLIGGEEVNINDVKSCILKELKNRLNIFFLGESIKPTGEGCPRGVFALKVEKEKKVFNNMYITIVSKDLDFLITTNTTVQFWHCNRPVDTGTSFTGGDNIVTFEFEKSKNMSDEVYQDILLSIREEGHYVFYHTDSELPDKTD